MINNQTVIVLGAGASMDFGFPSGIELKEKIINLLIEKDIDPSASTKYQNLISLGYTSDDIEDFIQSFLYSGSETIDSFLEYRPQFEKLGKAAIAQELIPREDLKSLFLTPNGKNWYSYIFKELNTRFEKIQNNNFSVITFNYDRSFEQYLSTAIKYAHQRTDKEVAEKMSHFKIIHMHGQLGYLPWQKSSSEQKIVREYSSICTPEKIKIASEYIKNIHEGDKLNDNLELTLANEELGLAERIIFLGFGYNQVNLDRLNLKNFERTNVEIRGSCYGLTLRERDQIINKILPSRYLNVQTDRPRRIQLGDPTLKTLDFLRENITFSERVPFASNGQYIEG